VRRRRFVFVSRRTSDDKVGRLEALRPPAHKSPYAKSGVFAGFPSSPFWPPAVACSSRRPLAREGNQTSGLEVCAGMAITIQKTPVPEIATVRSGRPGSASPRPGANKRFFHRVRATIGLGLPGTARLLRRSTPSGISASSAAGRGISEMLLLRPPRLVLPSVPVRIVLAAGAFSPLNAKV